LATSCAVSTTAAPGDASATAAATDGQRSPKESNHVPDGAPAATFEEWLKNHPASNYSDDMEDAYQHGRSSRNAEVCRLLDTIRNQNREMERLHEELRLGGYRERAYVEAINDLVEETVKVRARARSVMEGPDADPIEDPRGAWRLECPR
jgi:hypothetical protein